jgi:acyl carrier protein
MPSAAAIELDLSNYIVQSAKSRGKTITTLSRTDDFVDREIFDSLSLLDFIQFIEKRCGITIPGEDIDPDNFGSLERIMSYLNERSK